MSESVAAFTPDWVSPPGDTVADVLEERGWSQAELAQRTGYTRKHVSQLINGKAPITEDTALKLEHVLGASARFWLNREVQYREALAREEELDALSSEADWLKELPLGEMIRFGWVKKFAHKGRQVGECLSFFGVASVHAWRRQYANPVAAFHASDKFPKDGAAVATWLRQGERQAESIETAPFDKAGFKRILAEELRPLTNEPDPEVFLPQLQASCAQVGVAVMLEPAPKGCAVSGATKWLSPSKALLMLSLRHKSNDHLWFSFFHEAGHLLLHGKKMLFLELEGLDDAHEKAADQFASDLLISPDEARRLPYLNKTKVAVRSFADHLGIAPGIVVGRMQKEGLLPWTHLNGLKVRYKWGHEG